MTAYRTALTSAHITAILFGLTGIFGALIHASTGVITFGRAAFAMLSLAVFAQLQGRLLWGLNRVKLANYCVSGLMLAAHCVTFFIAIKVGGVAVATLGFASFPAFIALLDMAVFRDRPCLPEMLLLMLITLGLVLVTPSFELANQGTVGLLWGLASGLSFALLAMTNRRATDGRNGVQVVFWQNAVIAVLMAPFAVFTWWSLVPWTGST
ncbi:DMT family transporter [Pseudomonas yamanorum]|uniref:DMT family transporter n=1 Tax=Pseudomonas yamanorum TaxID=515393 RepID=UPI00352741CA